MRRLLPLRHRTPSTRPLVRTAPTRAPLLSALAATAAVATLLVVPATASSAATVVPPAPRAAAGIEQPAAYVPAVSCDGVLKPGTAKLAALLSATYRGTTSGTVRACGTDGSTSEHYDGRAVDWMTTMRTADGAARGNALVAWLLATDAKGNAFANARRLGVMYVIWNGKIWGAYRPTDGWRPYSSCASHPEASWDTACHRDHVHLSLSWEGAMGRTSYWTGSVAARDYGPCRVADLAWAPPYTGPRSTPCPSVPTPSAPSGSSSMVRTLVAASGMVLRPGASGSAVAAVNQALGVGTSTAFGSATGAAVTRLQSAKGLARTGIVDTATWRALTGPYLTAQVSPLGAFDAATPGYQQVTARGWAFDGESSAAVSVRVTVDGRPVTALAGGSRPDVARAFPGKGSAHGYNVTVPVGTGVHQVCVLALNAGAGVDTNLGCRTATVNGDPTGHLDVVTSRPGAVTVQGWAIDPQTTGAIPVRVTVGSSLTTVAASAPRPDVARVFARTSGRNGLAVTLPASRGGLLVCVTAVNVGVGRDTSLGCSAVTVR